MAIAGLDRKVQPIRPSLTLDTRRRAPRQMHQQVSIYFTWARLGTVSLDHEGMLVLPVAPARPAVFRIIRLTEDEPELHLGSAPDLATAFLALSNGIGPSRLRQLKQRLVERLSAGDALAVDAVTSGVVIPPNEPPRPADLHRPNDRQLLSLVARMSSG
jgi:hypothetical protein